MNYVCVFAHPDDEMRCLGTLLRLRAAGHKIAFITISAGEKGLPFDPDSTTDASLLRDKEMAEVAAAFDAERRCLGAEDGFVYDDGHLRRELIMALRELRAEVIFTHWTQDYNPDHVKTAELVVDASLLAPLASFVPGTGSLPAAPRIWHTDPGPGFSFEATHLVELTAEHLARKQELMRLHRSQMEVMQQLSGSDYADQLARANRVTGDRMLCHAAEGFRPCLAERRIPWPSDLPGQLAP